MNNKDIKINNSIKDITNYLLNEPILIKSILHITEKCNFRCLHCYQTPLRESRNKELNYNEWILIIDELKRKGCKFLRLTGGEVFTKIYFLELYKYCYKNNFILDILTNASLLGKKENLDCIIKYKPKNIIVSIYGASNKTYKIFTGLDNGWDIVKSNIEYLVQNKVNVKVQTVLNRYVKKEVYEIQNFCNKNNIIYNVYPRISNYCDGNNITKTLMLNMNEIWDIMNKLGKSNEWNKKILQNSECWQDNIKKCFAGISVCSIDAQGKMYLCEGCSSSGLKWSVLDNGIEFCWNKLKEQRKKEIEVITRCSVCKLRNYCGLCAPLFKRECGLNRKKPIENCKYGHALYDFLNKKD